MHHSLLASIRRPALPALVIALLFVTGDDVINAQQQDSRLGENTTQRLARWNEEGLVVCHLYIVPAINLSPAFYQS